MSDPDDIQPGLLRITVEHTPSPNDPKGADDFYRTLGMFMVAWGRLEGLFVVSLITLLNIVGDQLGTQLPMRQEDRIKLWRKAFTITPQLAPFKAAALSLLAELEDLSKDRHTLVHALWEPFGAATPPTIDIVTIKHKNKTINGLETNRHTVTLETLQQIARKANRLNLTMGPISFFLSRLRAAQNPPPENIRRV